MADLSKELQQESIFQGLNNEKTTGLPIGRYTQSKLLELMYIRALAPRINPVGQPRIIVNCLNPGMCYSDLAPSGPAKTIAQALLARKTEIGARTEISAAAAGLESHGQYMNLGIVGE